MIKALVFMSRKDGISRQEFIDYYEGRHTALVRRVFPTIGDYRRNYLVFDEKHQAYDEEQPSDHPGFDVVTEISFASEGDWQAFLGHMATPELIDEIAADESNFMDRSKHRFFRVDEFASG